MQGTVINNVYFSLQYYLGDMMKIQKYHQLSDIHDFDATTNYEIYFQQV